MGAMFRLKEQLAATKVVLKENRNGKTAEGTDQPCTKER
jgi:hypothetical protein